MDKQTDLLMNLSVLYRSTQKYYDRMLQSIRLTYAQLPILIMIYEQEGVSMRDIAQSGVYDKGTISKSVKHLEQQGFIRIETSRQDKRNKELYTTDYAKQQMSMVYSIRRDWWQHLVKDIDQDGFDTFISSYEIMAQNAREYAEHHQAVLHFFKWQKVSLSAYKDHISTILYTGGSNFRSPFDEHPELVFISENLKEVDADGIHDYLKKRRGIIEAVCIKGGEPFMYEELADFLKVVKEMGYKVKIYTNGSFPNRLKEYIEQGWIDSISLDIKNSPSGYAKSIGMSSFDVRPINDTIEYLIRSKLDYECTLHIVKEYHTTRSIQAIGKWLKGIRRLIVYNNIEQKHTIVASLHSVSECTYQKYIAILKEYIEDVVEGV